MVRSGDKTGVMVKFPMSDGEIRCWMLKSELVVGEKRGDMW